MCNSLCCMMDDPSFKLAGMRVLHWCMLGVTILLLVCEVAISQLCKSLITLVDGFHTLFILMRMALPPPQTASIIKPSLSHLNSPASPPHAFLSSAGLLSSLPAQSSIKLPPGNQTAIDGSAIPDQPPAPQFHCEAASLVNSHQHFSSKLSPPALSCGLSYTTSRVQTVGMFISALVLASLCLSYIMEIISFTVEPHPVKRPLLLVVVGAVSVLHKMLVLGLNWDELLDWNKASRQPGTKSHLVVNHKVMAEEETKGEAELGRVQSAVEDMLHNGALVLCNPGTSCDPDTDSQTPQRQPAVHLHAAPPRDSSNCEVTSGVADLSHLEDITEIYKDKTCMGYLDSQHASITSPVCKSSDHIKIPVPVYFLSFVPVVQGLCTSLLSLSNSLVMLLVGPQCLHSSGTCGFLVYLDPALSLLAVITLIATATPQVHRYGLLLLQATPPHICVYDLGRKIASVPGVQAVHDLHVWQLTESFTVASVHVHCHAGFPAHRCADLMSGVTRVLQSVGVSCCTVQPEFAYCSAGNGSGDQSAVVHREDPSQPPLLACSLACGKACAGNMCCTPLGEESRSLLAPPAGETKEEPQTLVIENTFL
ncbi:zinc transporter 1 isoform X1 [Micropterus dolomieu]|uniref:zinc transporter 1 isoform X1 n=1 Tax=Micropterus dolomieu TaxID=147949 RepID=UPI001E8CCC89|nr:zinc transporter 1 isoform X1 [Micropterus dolomieu]